MVNMENLNCHAEIQIVQKLIRRPCLSENANNFKRFILLSLIKNVDTNGECVVKDILDKRIIKRKIQYSIK